MTNTPKSPTPFEAMFARAEPEGILNARRPVEPPADDGAPDQADPEPDPMRRLARRLFPRPTEK
jgi:hypothetical protein